ncbi:acyl-CoA dehydrogenase family protein [Ideonella livida]|uniref:Acyl-CoA dehydrogenase n=1 Tax=Ideonella livida TaxID=2707176 RepID=A0A7C9TK36_9BURK|nr:acyl-CoA dehydrogenase family protein [Ideonella livida]NDY91383.1 acyl-CoA dehydrogenase [Ideonella livida]
MDFDFSDDQLSLRDMVARWVDKAFPFDRRHALAKAGGAARAVHTELAELGLTALVIPEAHGGMGLGAVEAMVVMEELGRGLVNAPYTAGALMSPCLLAAAPEALQAAWLPRMADGSALVVPALQEKAARYRLNRVSTRAEAGTDGVWRLSGRKSLVPAGDEADAFLVPARVTGTLDDEAGIALFLVPRDAAGLCVGGHPLQDGARAAELQLENTPATLVLEQAWDRLSLAQDVGIAAIAAESVGLMDRLTALTVDYLNTRKQFGVTLATFQALRHRIADVKMQLELARSMSYYATLKLGEAGDARRRALSQAKVQVGQSARFVGQQCMQLHGGIGITDEYLGSHYFKRLTAVEMQFGDTLHHLGEVSDRMQATAGVFA